MNKFIIFLFAFFLVSCSIQETVASTRTSVKRTAEQIEAEEFAELIKQDSINKHDNAAKSLEVLLGEDPKDKRISLIVNNNSNCNIILRFAGEKSYQLPIKKNFRNFIVIEKGTYSLGANLCSARYSSTKTFTESLSLSISESK